MLTEVALVIVGSITAIPPLGEIGLIGFFLFLDVDLNFFPFESLSGTRRELEVV